MLHGRVRTILVLPDAPGRPIHREPSLAMGDTILRTLPGPTHPAALLAPLFVLACADGGTDGAWEGELRDSAGVAIVENRGRGLWTPEQAWRVREDLVLGTDETRPETHFGHVADLAVDPAGRLYVLDQLASVVRVFAADGTPAGTLGGPGEGPGELSRLASSVFLVGDTVHVVDWAQSRVVRFLPDGTTVGSDPLPGDRGARSWWSVAPDGGLVFRSLRMVVDEQRRWRPMDHLVRASRDGTELDTLLTFQYPPSDLGGPGNVVAPLVVNVPDWTLLEDGRVAWTTVVDEVVRVHDARGTLERVVTREAWERRRLTEEDEAVLARLLGEKMEMLGGRASVLELIPLAPPSLLPAVTSVRGGPEGTLWVQRMGDVRDVHPMTLNGSDPPTGFGGREWDVMDAQGRYLGSVELPPRFRLLTITGDALYGVRRGELDVEEVLRLRLERGAPPEP